jgi:AAA domain/Zinc finger C-x8-C-x5-C-x3-H type (and similar)
LYDLGYIGDSINELACCKDMASKSVIGSVPRLISSVANPALRSLATYRSPSFEELLPSTPRPVPANERQLAVLAGLKYDVEGIQGPPGTGKSTIILHAIRTFLPRGSATSGEGLEVVLATCVQNKAVDAIADKLAKAYGAAGKKGEEKINFFVFGNEERLGLVSRLWTLDAQVERDIRVQKLKAALGRFQEMRDIVSKTVRAGMNRFDKSQRHQRYVESRAILKFGDPPSASTAEKRQEREDKIQAYIANNPWSRCWPLFWAARHPRLYWTWRFLVSKVTSLDRDLTAMKATVRAELIRKARAVLCTVATASRSLLTTEELLPCATKITTAILDEAGTCPESKMPLLLMLPRSQRILAIGDQKQLSPFSHWTPYDDHKSGGSGGGGGGSAPFGVCRSYYSTGRCSYGHRCKFSHIRGSSSSYSPHKSSSAGGLREAPKGFFQRLAEALPASAVPSLLDQYRMHERIADFVSTRVYNGTLRTPSAVADARRKADPAGLYWLQYHAPLGAAEEKPARSHSTINPTEAALALKVFQLGEAAGYLCTPRKRFVHRPAARAGAGAGRSADESLLVAPKGRSVAIITLYKAQEFYLRKLFNAAGIFERESDPGAETDADGVGSLRILTVDQAQGSEADVVILSLVRSNAKRSMGFATNKNRMNVAVSRARERLVVIGDVSTMATNDDWKALLEASVRVHDAESVPAMGERV